MVHFFSLLYLAVIILQPGEWIKLFDGVPIQEIYLMFGLLFAIVTHTRRIKEVVFSIPSRLFLGFILIIIVSSANEGQSYAIGLYGYMYLKYYLGFLLLVVANNSDAKLNRSLNFLVICTLVICYHCINLYHNGVEIGHGIGESAHILNWRGSVQWLGTFAGSNTTGLLLLMPFAISLGLLYKQESFFVKLYYFFTTIVIGYSFYLTHSRGGFIGFMVIAGYFFFIKTRMRLIYFVPSMLLLAVAVMILKPQEEGRGFGESSTPERIELLHQGLEMFKESPVVGVGTGQFPKNNPVHKTAHNIYLNTLAENGFIGLFLFILMYYLPVREIIKLTKNQTIVVDSITITQMTKQIDINKAEKIAFSLIGERLNHIVLMLFGGVAATLFFLSARHEVPMLVVAFITAVAMNHKASFNISIREVKWVLIIMFVLITLIYVAIQLFFKFYR